MYERWMMKRTVYILLFLIILSLPLSLCSCGTGYEGEVNVYNWGEYISNGDDDTMDVIKEFEIKYNIKVNYTNFETNEELYNILKNSNVQYDVIVPSDYMVERLINENMLEEIDYSNIPHYENIMDIYKGLPYDPENRYSVPFTSSTVGLVYNKKMVDPEDVDGFDVLWNEKYKGQILMINNSKDAMAIAMSLCDPKIDPGSSDLTFSDIDRATEKLVEQKGVLKKYVNDQVFPEMENNQAAMAPYFSGDINTMMDNNENLDYCLPEDGTNWFVDCLCIPTCCQNKENAELFIDFMCEGDVALANAEYIGYSTPNKEAFDMTDEETKENELIYPSEDYLRKCYMYSNLPNDVYNYMQERFVKACSTSADAAEALTVEDSVGASLSSKIAVLCIIIAVILLIIVVSIFDIRKAYINRNRLHKQ